MATLCVVSLFSWYLYCISICISHSHFSFFGGFGFKFGTTGNERSRDIPKGGTIVMTLEVSLEDLYNGNFIEVARYKPVPKAAQGTRKCNCRQEMKTQQMGPGQFQVCACVCVLVHQECTPCIVQPRQCISGVSQVCGSYACVLHCC